MLWKRMTLKVISEGVESFDSPITNMSLCYFGWASPRPSDISAFLKDVSSTTPTLFTEIIIRLSLAGQERTGISTRLLHN